MKNIALFIVAICALASCKKQKSDVAPYTYTQALDSLYIQANKSYLVQSLSSNDTVTFFDNGDVIESHAGVKLKYSINYKCYYGTNLLGGRDLLYINLLWKSDTLSASDRLGTKYPSHRFYNEVSQVINFNPNLNTPNVGGVEFNQRGETLKLILAN